MKILLLKFCTRCCNNQILLHIISDITMDGGAGTLEEEIIQGIGNEVFYFFMFLSLMLVIVGAWFSTQVVEPVVSSVILVERTSTAETQR